MNSATSAISPKPLGYESKRVIRRVDVGELLKLGLFTTLAIALSWIPAAIVCGKAHFPTPRRGAEDKWVMQTTNLENVTASARDICVTLFGSAAALVFAVLATRAAVRVVSLALTSQEPVRVEPVLTELPEFLRRPRDTI